MNLGDAIAAVATHVARMFHMDCVDTVTRQLKPESTCFKVKQALNEGRYADAFYDRFFPKPK